MLSLVVELMSTSRSVSLAWPVMALGLPVRTNDCGSKVEAAKSGVDGGANRTGPLRTVVFSVTVADDTLRHGTSGPGCEATVKRDG